MTHRFHNFTENVGDFEDAYPKTNVKLELREVIFAAIRLHEVLILATWVTVLINYSILKVLTFTSDEHMVIEFCPLVIKLTRWHVAQCF